MFGGIRPCCLLGIDIRKQNVFRCVLRKRYKCGVICVFTILKDFIIVRIVKPNAVAGINTLEHRHIILARIEPIGNERAVKAPFFSYYIGAKHSARAYPHRAYSVHTRHESVRSAFFDRYLERFQIYLAQRLLSQPCKQTLAHCFRFVYRKMFDIRI